MTSAVQNRSVRRVTVRLARLCGLRFKRNEKGVVTIEFALIMPILIIMYLGMFQISMVIIQSRHVSHSASVMADLATQGLSVNEREAANIMQAGLSVLQVSNEDVIINGDVALQLISVRMENDNPEIIGRAEIGTWDTPDLNAIDGRLLSNQSGAVIARVRYKYKFVSNGTGTQNPFRAKYVGGSPTLSEMFILKPRLTSELEFASETDSNDREFSCNFQSGGKVLCDGVSATPPATSGGSTTSLG